MTAAVEQWQKLMVEWEALSKELDAAILAADGASGTVERVALDANVERLKSLLAETQIRIDATVRQGRDSRDPNRDYLVVGEIEKTPADAEKPEEDGSKVGTG